MGREHRILAGLQTSAVPVPPVEGYCDDPSINDAPFYVMRFVDGHVLRDRSASEAASTAAARAYGEPVARRHDGRDPRGRSRRMPDSPTSAATTDTSNASSSAGTASGTRARPANSTPSIGCTTPCSNASPQQGRRRSSTATTASTTAWSTTTATSSPCSTGRSARSATRSPTSACCRCTGPVRATPTRRGPAPPRRRPGSGTAANSPSATPRCRAASIEHLDFYVAFAYWKLACILEGVYSRYLGGALGERSADELAPFKLQVEAAARAGRTAPGGAVDDRPAASTSGSSTSRCCTNPCSS